MVAVQLKMGRKAGSLGGISWSRFRTYVTGTDSLRPGWVPHVTLGPDGGFRPALLPAELVRRPVFRCSPRISLAVHGDQKQPQRRTLNHEGDRKAAENSRCHQSGID
jgi:hypothetical protein